MVKEKNIEIGVLALQGAYSLHRLHLEALDVKYKEVTKVKDLENCSGLIIPGGESSTMLKLINHQNLNYALNIFFKEKPTWGICAGLILLAKKVIKPEQKSFKAINIEVIRNGYGRQLEGQERRIKGHKVSFIRAPIIKSVGPGTEVLEILDKDPIFVKQKNIMVTTFHPEVNLNSPSPWHSYFLNMIKS